MTSSQIEWGCGVCSFCDKKAADRNKPCCTFAGKPAFDKTGRKCLNKKEA